MSTVTHAFDPAGTNPLNRIVNEQHVITSVNSTDFHFIIPRKAPFFMDGVTFTFQNTDGSYRDLVEGVDYYYTNHFIDASKACAKSIAGSLTFLDKATAGVLRISYQTIGGIWTLDEAEILEIIANNTLNPRTTAWEQIVELPVRFPVVDHEWDLVDMVGATEIVEALELIAQTIAANTGGGLAAHVQNRSNPHEVTKTQVGLANVLDYPVATQAQAEGGSNGTTYMTPLRTAQAISAQVGNVVAVHADRNDNPHSVSKVQVGLGNVENLPLATNIIATAGTSHAHYMTPLMTATVVAIVRSELQAHAANTNNPHAVVKEQILLANVQNYSIASAAEAQAGDVNDRYMTPLRTKQAITALANSSIAAHTSDISNPHQVTKAQVGLGSVDNFATASQVEATNVNVNNRFMTPQRTAEAVTSQVGTAFQSHLNAVNPHNVTRSDVGLSDVLNYAVATQAEAQAGTVNNKYMTPTLVRDAILALGSSGSITAHLADVENPHQVTAAQVGATTLVQVNNLITAATADLVTRADFEDLRDQVTTSIAALAAAVAALMA